ncbi:MAG: Ig-like domain repeat protein [Actinomycetota bacterium]
MQSSSPPRGRFIRVLVATILAATALVAGGATPTPPVSAGVDDGWEMIDVGHTHSCGLTTVDEIFCWGGGNEGQLGDGTTNTLLRQLIPLEVAAPAGVTWASVDTGAYHTCATTTGGDIYCWGVDDEGRLGNGNVAVDDFFPSPTLVDRPAGVTWAAVSAAGSHTCALTTSGDVYCFGENDRGQLGVGDENPRNTPTQVGLPTGVVVDSLEVGTGVAGLFDSRTTCVVSTLGAGYCWGSDELGALGDGPGEVNSNVPVAIGVPGGGAWSTIRPGGRTTCGVTTTGVGYCWGRDDRGQLGNGSTGSGDLTPQPVTTPVGATWSAITPSTTFTCGVTTDGELFCWGNQVAGGQLGDGTLTTSDYDEPNEVVTPPTFPVGAEWVDVRSTWLHSCAVDSNGTGWCWGGDGNGRLGDDAPTVTKPVPAQVGDRTGGPQDMVFFEQRDRSLAEPPFGLFAEATSGLPVEFAAIGGCTVSGRLVTLIAAGICEITATQPGDADWDPATPIVRQFTIIEASPPPQFDAGFAPATVAPGGSSTITFELSHPLGTETATDVGFTGTFGLLTVVGITSNTCTTGTATIDAADVLTYADGVLDVDDACAISVEVTAPSSAPSYPTSYPASGGRLQSSLGLSPLVGAANLRVELATGLSQTISMPNLGPWPLVDGPRPLSATATSGLPVSFSATGVCTVVADELVFSGLGQCEVTASQAGDSTYAAAPDQVRTFDVVQAAQTIDFAALSDWPLGGGVRSLSATASSGLDVAFSAAGTCTASGSDLTPTGVGTCTVTASQPGDADYLAAPDVERSFEVLSNAQTIDFQPLSDWGRFDGARSLSATATSGLPVEFAAVGVCSVIGAELTVSAVGECTVTASQPGNAAFGLAPDVEQRFNVVPGEQTIDFPILSEWSVLDGTRSLSATASSGLPVTFGARGPCTVDGTDLSITGLGVCEVTASQAGNADYNAAPDLVRGFEVVPATQTIDFPPIDDIRLNETATATATATSGLPISLAAAGACSIASTTVTPTSPGVCSITATQAGNANYAAAVPVVRQFTVQRAQAQVIVTGPADDTLVGTPATFSVDLPDLPGVPAPSGTFRFAVVGGQTTDVEMVGGIATLTIDDLPAGLNEVGGEYLGDANFAPSPAVAAFHEVVRAALELTGLPSTVTVGEQVTVSAAGFDAAETITFVLNSDPVTVGTATSNATGTATLAFAVPDVDAGPHTLTATGERSGLQVGADTTVEVAPPTTPPTTPTPTPPTTPTVPATPDLVPVAPDATPDVPAAIPGGPDNAPTATPAPAPVLTTELPATGGTGIGAVLAAAAALIIAGLSVVALSRRRRSIQPM